MSKTTARVGSYFIFLFALEMKGSLSFIQACNIATLTAYILLSGGINFSYIADSLLLDYKNCYCISDTDLDSKPLN